MLLIICLFDPRAKLLLALTEMATAVFFPCDKSAQRLTQLLRFPLRNIDNLPHRISLHVGSMHLNESPPRSSVLRPLSSCAFLFHVLLDFIHSTIHRCFDLPLFLVLCTSNATTLCPTYSSSLLIACPNHLDLFSHALSASLACFRFLSHPALLLSTSASTYSFPPHPTYSRALPSPPMSRPRTTALV